jgi:hypothetical protein
MEFIDILPIIIIMFMVGAVALACGVMSYRMYKRLPITPYLFQSIALWFFGLFCLCMSIGLLFSSDILFNFGLSVFTVSLMFYAKFFRELFGQYRKYEVIQIIMGVFLGLVILISILFPPLQIVEYEIQYNSDMIFLAFGYVVFFFVVVVDYTIFSLRKIKNEHLSHKLSYFSITIIASMITTGGGMICTLLFSWHLVTPFTIQVIFIIIIFVLLKKYPSLNFLALLNPQYLTITHSSGSTLYTHSFQVIEMEEILGGAISGINMLFKEVFNHQGIEQIHFRGKVIYSKFRPDFVIIYIDNVYMPFIDNVLNEFADIIAIKYQDVFKNFNEELSKFEGIEQEMRRVFYFLPQLM